MDMLSMHWMLLGFVIAKLWDSSVIAEVWTGSGDSEDGDVYDESIMTGSGDGHKKTETYDTDPNQEPSSSSHNYVRDKVDEFLSIVEEYERNKDTCEPGVQFNLGDGVITQYGVNRFKAQALLAVNRANFLTRLWKGLPQMFQLDEFFFYTQVRSLIEGDDDIFGAGNCYDKDEFANYFLFCPYGFRMPNDSKMIMLKDLASEYPYLGNESEFFLRPRQNAEKKLNETYTVSHGWSLYPGESFAIKEDIILSEYEDGHWSRPYFDCKGGDIWMMTYTVPFFGYNATSEQYYFKGTSGIDIDLQKVDIDQCPLPEGSSSVNVFAGSDKCKEDTTKCVPVPMLGFRRGSYKCECKKGFYFPNLNLPERLRYYNGSQIEAMYDKQLRGESLEYDHSFFCLKCAPGCEECKDGSACILELHWLQRSIVLALSCFIMGFIPVLVLFTVRFSNIKVLKAASPILLRTILFGAFLLYCPMIVNYFEPTEVSCSLRIWLREIGFSISYGALLLKTWRISVVFRVRSAQRIKISDTDLIKRLVLIVLCFSVYLSVRMVVGRPRVVKGVHSSGLHAFQCSWDVWDYCAAIAELCLLLWGIRLCIVVRKAPSEFNESRFISWAIYNETLLSLFLNITMFFLQSPANPDLLYLVLFIHSQLTTTVTLAFLFCSKAYLVYKYRDKEQPPTTMRGGSKYTAAPKSATTHLTINSSMNNSCVTTDKLCDGELECPPITLEKDIQDEFKRLSMQLETLKQRNMRLGNPHLGCKLADVTKTDSPPPSPPNINGKTLVINLEDLKDSTCL